jgi:hypothetical protein
MGWLDKAKVFLGIVDDADVGDDDDAPRAARRPGARDKGDRPPLDGLPAAAQESLEDVLAARDAGDTTEMRRLLRTIDRGTGLRTVLRAAAALEARDEGELMELLPAVRAFEPAWRLPLQLSMAFDDPERAKTLATRAAELGAPGWAVAWSRALSREPSERREGLVALLVADAALARTVAARDLATAGATPDPAAAQRYASFAHGRDCIRRFGAALVDATLERAHARGR